jgi:3-methyl-2-oxobutanoate hydroxymethyltransferase
MVFGHTLRTICVRSAWRRTAQLHKSAVLSSVHSQNVDTSSGKPTQATKTPARVTLESIALKYQSKTPLSVLTAYDASSARLVNDSPIDMILVGDSLGMVSLGYDSTTSVTMSDMIHHCKAVARGISAKRRAFVIGDMPFGSYTSTDLAIKNAFTLVQEGQVDAVKLEGGQHMAASVRSIVSNGVPVMGHIGLTPQTAFGSFKVRSKVFPLVYCMLIPDVCT